MGAQLTHAKWQIMSSIEKIVGLQFYHSQLVTWVSCDKSCIICYDPSIFQKCYPSYLTPFGRDDISGEGIGSSYGVAG